MRLLLLENGLINEISHHHASALGYLAETRRRGIDCLIFTHRRVSPELVAKFGARPIFVDRPYSRRSIDPLCGELEDAIFFGKRFALSCRALREIGPGDDDVVMVPSARCAEMLGLGSWLEGMEPARRPRVVLNFHLDDFVDPATRNWSLPAAIYRYAAKRLLAQLPVERVLMTATNHALAELMSKILPLRVSAYPAQHHYVDDADIAAPPEPRGGRILVSVLGGIRPEKGSLLLPETLRLCAADRPDLSFFVQLSTELKLRGWDEFTAALRDVQAVADLELRSEPLDEVGFARQICRSDLVLCPYDPRRYVARISGIVVDAFAYGRPCVVPEGTWMAAQLHEGRGAGVAFTAYSAPMIAAAVREAAGRLDALRALAAARAPSWRREQCVGAYLDRMLAEFGSRPA